LYGILGYVFRDEWVELLARLCEEAAFDLSVEMTGDLKNDFPGQSEEVLVVVEATQVVEDKGLELSVDSTKETKFWKRKTRSSVGTSSRVAGAGL
jgi:hypothetical protein